MKRNLFAGVIFGLALLALAAVRDAAAQRWDARFYGGWNSANFYGGSKLLGSEDKNGFMTGLGAEYLRAEDDVLGFEFGVAYVQKGAKGRIEPNSMDPLQPPIQSTFEGEAKLDYVELSLLFDIHLPTGDRSEVKLGIGPALGLLTSAKLEGSLDGAPVESDIDKYLDGIDFGIALSATFAYAFDKFTLGGGVRGTLGAMSIDNTALENDLKTRTVGVILEVTVPLAR